MTKEKESLINMGKISLLLVFSTLLCVFLFSACSAKQSEGYILIDNEKVIPESVLTIGGMPVPFDEYRYVYLYMKDSYDGGDLTYWDGDGKNIEELKKSVHDYCAETYAMKIMAKELGIVLDDGDYKETDTYLESVKSSYDSDKDYDEDLSRAYLTRDLYRRLLLDNLLSRKLYDHFYGENGTDVMTDEEYAEFYGEHYYAAKHILVRFEEGESFENAERVTSIINRAYEALENGTPFDEVLEEFGEDEEMVKDYKTGYHFTEGEMVTGFYEAAKELEIGEYSEPVMTNLGYHIILRCEIDPEVRESMKKDVLVGFYDEYNNWYGGYYETCFYELIKERIDNGSIEFVYSDIYEKINPYNMH